MTINIISDKRDDREEADDLPDQGTHKPSSLSWIFPKTSNNKNKGKGKDTGNWQERRPRKTFSKKSPDDGDDNSSSDEESDKRDV